MQAFRRLRHVKIQIIGQSQSGRCVRDVVIAGNAETDGKRPAMKVQMEGSVCFFVMGRIREVIIVFRRSTEGNNTTGQPVRDFRKLRNGAVYNKKAVLWNQFRKAAEGRTDVGKILKKVHVIFFYIKNDADLRKEA